MNTEFRKELEMIRQSEVYERMRFQRHHFNTTLLKHVLSVTEVCSRISSFLKRRGMKIHERELYIAAICHDMGMTDRYDRNVFPTHRDLALKHGEQSVYYARKILKEHFTRREEEIIKNHMFPLLLPPRSIEGLILICADKYRTILDFLGR